MKIALFLIFFSLSSWQASCVNAASESVNNNNAGSNANHLQIQIPSRPQISANVEIFGRWWSKQQIQSNWPEGVNPPKDDYLKLETWDASEGTAPHPDKIDLVCNIDNADVDLEGLKIVALTDFKIASYRTITNQKSEDALSRFFDRISWTDEVKVGEIGSLDLKSHESHQIKFTDFDLESLLKKYFQSTHDLWPWKMRIIFKIFDQDGRLILASEKTIELIPGD